MRKRWPAIGRKRTASELIALYSAEVSELRNLIVWNEKPERRAKLEKQIDIKTKIIAKLESQLNAEQEA
jgi:hypothetical protein